MTTATEKNGSVAIMGNGCPEDAPKLDYYGRVFRFPFRGECKPLTADEQTRLKASIEEFGVQSPVTVDPHDNVIDGEHRLYQARDLEIPLVDVPFRVANGTWDRLRKMTADLNEARRQYTKEELKAAAAARKQQVSEKRSEGKSTRQIADEVGVSQAQVRRDLKESEAKIPGETAVSPGGTTQNPQCLDASADSVPNDTAEDTPEPAKVTGKDGKRHPASKKKGKGKGSKKASEAAAKQEEETPKEPAQPEKLHYPEKVNQAFADVAVMRGLVQTLGKVRNQVQALREAGAGGALLDQHVGITIEEASRYISSAMPFRVCPDCRGERSCSPGKHSNCRSRGWITKATYANLPPEKKLICDEYVEW